jgi:hypothetical protein
MSLQCKFVTNMQFAALFSDAKNEQKNQKESKEKADA